MKSGDCCPAGTGDSILQFSGMPTGAKQHLGSSQKCLSCQASCHGPRQPHPNSTITERLNDLKRIGRTAPGKSGYRIQKRLSNNLDNSGGFQQFSDASGTLAQSQVP